MRVPVRLFARACDLAGGARLEIELPAGATVADLRRELVRTRPPLAPLASALLIAIGNEYAPDSLTIGEGQEVACFPPVSGG